MSGDPRKPRRGDQLEVRVTGSDSRGRALGATRDEHGREYRAVLRGGVLGDLARAEVLRRRGDRLELRVLALIEGGPDRVTPRCRHFGTCGGCSHQDLAYPAQLVMKRERARAELTAAGLAGIEVEAVVGDPQGWRYRNKMEYTFASRRWVETGEPAGVATDFALGLHVPGRFDKVLDVRECPIVFAQAEAILASARRLALERGLPPWDVHAHQGLLRHLVLRKGVRTNQILVNLVTSREAPEEVDPYAAELLARHPEITTLVQNVNTRAAAIAVGEWERVLHGPGRIRERLCGLEFEISAASFFQTNTVQAEALFTAVREEAALSGSELVYDLYCGTGSIALVLAGGARAVRGYEQVPAAVADARRNAERNGITNASFVEGDVLERLAVEAERPDVCIVDPPRAGLHPRVLPRLAELHARRIVWVSCNLRTAAPQVAWLVAQGYRLARARPYDLFPHTPHLECVLTLEREDGGA